VLALPGGGRAVRPVRASAGRVVRTTAAARPVARPEAATGAGRGDGGSAEESDAEESDAGGRDGSRSALHGDLLIDRPAWRR
jgi:hypothetical protein